MTNYPPIDSLCEAWLEAKAAEVAANKRRIAIEQQIIAITGNKPEGAETKELGGFKITTTGKMNRTMDWEKWKEVMGQIPEALRPVKIKPELDVAGVRYLQANRPDIYAKLPITVTPAKVSVEVKRVEG